MKQNKIYAKLSGFDVDIFVSEGDGKKMYRVYDLQDTDEAIRLYKLKSHQVMFIGSFSYV